MASSGGSERFETVIIGGGQAGLAVGYHLARRERSVVIVDANQRIGDSWRERWDSLRVFTPARYDALPGWSFPAPRWSYPTKDEVADYLESYATRFGLPVRSGIRVDALSREHDGYVVSSGPNRYQADNVVVATGGYQAPRIPVFASGARPEHRAVPFEPVPKPAHSSATAVSWWSAPATRAPRSPSNRHPDHQTWLSGRDTGQEPVRAGSLSDRLFTPPFWFLLSHVLTTRNPIGRKVRDQLSHQGLPLARVRRKDLVRARVERVPRVTGVRDGLPLLEDGAVLEVANVIWCTGFASDFSWIDLPVLDQGGQPSHQRGVVRSEPGLYFMGLFFQSAGTSSLIGGVGRDARHIARHITARPVGAGSMEEPAARPADQVSN